MAAAEAALWPALIISETLERYLRAASAVRSMGFNPSWLPAVMPPSSSTIRSDAAWASVGDQHTGKGCPLIGDNGLRAAHRNAWNLIVAARVPMGVFEDDVVATTDDIQEAQSYMHGAENHDVVFLSEGPALIFMTTAALWITPRAARWMLNSTTHCVSTKLRGGFLKNIDHNMAAGCNEHALRCRHALKRNNRSALGGGTGNGGRFFGIGLFAQDRVGVRPYLHSANNRRVNHMS